VVAPITHNKEGQLLNTNADTIAQEIARAMSDFFEVNLIYSFEKKGVLLDPGDESTLISSIGPGDYEQLKAEKKIFAGMIPKSDNAFAALNSGVKQVTIGKAEDLKQLITHSAGTRITND
jgi:acetylglutamate kinase